MQLDDVLISVVSAEVEAELPAAESVRVNSVSGAADVMLLRADAVKVDTVSGDVVLRCAAVPGSIDADAVSGDVTVLLPENAGFTAEVDSVSGRIGGQLLDGAGDGKTYTRGNGACRIRLDSVSGALRLDAYVQ